MTNTEVPELERVPSGIAGLDTILRGGFLRGGVYIVQGTPGAGKTILANQACFRHVAGGGRAVYVTLLAESHARMLQHLRPLGFYDGSVVPDQLYYVSAFRVLEDEGLKSLLDLLRREIRGHRASLLVVDGFLAVEESASSARELKKFVHEIQTLTSMANCTALLLTNGSTRPSHPEHTMVDGLIELEDTASGVRTERGLWVRKFRGSGFLRGRHPFRITEHGIQAFPRIEVAFATPSQSDQASTAKISVGVPDLDAMIGGGIPAATTTALIGPTGIGKTTFGLHFLSLSDEAEPGLFFGFYETPPRLCIKAASFGIDLAGMEKRGEVEFIWHPQGENVLDELGHRLLDAVQRRGVKRLFVDGLGGIMQSATDPERITRFFSVLANELRARGVTTIYTIEMQGIFDTGVAMPVAGISSLIENLIMLRYVEVESELCRFASVLKIRESGFDPMLRQFHITGRGIEMGEPFRGAEDILSGAAHLTADANLPSTHPPAHPPGEAGSPHPRTRSKA